MLVYILPLLLLTGFFYIVYRNSPKHAWLMLGVIAASLLVCIIKPSRIFFPIGLFGGLIAFFIVIIKSRNVRERSVQKWFADQGFKRKDFPFLKELFDNYAIGTNEFYSYTNELLFEQKKIPYILAVNYRSHRSNNSTSITFHCTYFFNEQVDVDLLEQKFKAAKNATPSTNLFKSQLGYFNKKSCEIFRPAMGGVAVRWRVPHSVEGYNDRYEWIKSAFDLKELLQLSKN